MANYEWLSKRTPRSVDELRLWADNPRLNPEENHIYLSDYAEDLISDSGERDSLCDLIKSISEIGFIPSDPIVVWQNAGNNKFYVAEGNRRILALKLLRNPDKAPRSIRGLVRKCATQVNQESIKKVLVSIAPSFQDAEWYINQRNNASSLQRAWSRVQQQRWIATLYDKYEGDIDKILSITSMSKPEIESYIRILKLKDFIKIDDVRNKLTEEEFEKANSHRFPITILERFFGYAAVKERWGIEYNGIEIILKSNKDSFYNAFATLIKRIVNDGEDKIDTRMKADDAPGILDSLPEVSMLPKNHLTDGEYLNEDIQQKPSQENSDVDNTSPQLEPLPPKPQKNDPNRSRLVLNIYTLNTTNTKLLGVFNELQNIPLKYNHSISATMRVFLDLAVLNYIQAEDLEKNICAEFKSSLKEITLNKRLTYIKDKHLKGKVENIASQLLNPTNQYSLDVLNCYVHSNDTHYSEKQFLNQFWDFMFPLFEYLLDIKEL